MARKALVAIVVVVLAGVSAVLWAYSGVVRRHSRVVEDLPPYGDELRHLPPYGDSPTPADEAAERYSGPGWYPRRSPDGVHVAVTTSWGGLAAQMLLLGILLDRPHIHTVNVWDEKTSRLVPVVSIKEMDPQSGIAHRYAWSRDSKALLIYGSGRLPEDFDKVLDLCVVYLPASDELYRLSNCPEPWQRNTALEVSSGPQNNKMQLTSGGLVARFARLHQCAACS